MPENVSRTPTRRPVRLAVAISSPGRGSATNRHLARTVPTLADWLVSEDLLIKWMRTPTTMEPLSLIVSVSTASISMPWFLKVDLVQHFTDGPEDLAPEAWVVTTMDAPSEPEGCLALVDALGERSWEIEGSFGSDHPFSGAVDTWKGTQL